MATIDSVGAQANRLEPLFKVLPLAKLVPPVSIQVDNEKSVSLLDSGHRLGEASGTRTSMKAFAALEEFEERRTQTRSPSWL